MPRVAVSQECALYPAGLAEITRMQHCLCYCHATNLMQLCILFWRGTLQPSNLLASHMTAHLHDHCFSSLHLMQALLPVSCILAALFWT